MLLFLPAHSCQACHFLRGTRCFVPGNIEFLTRTVWPSGLRRWLQAPVRKGVGSNPTAVISGITCHGTVLHAYLTSLIPTVPRHFPRSSLGYQSLFPYAPCPRSFLLCVLATGSWMTGSSAVPGGCHFLGSRVVYRMLSRREH